MSLQLSIADQLSISDNFYKMQYDYISLFILLMIRNTQVQLKIITHSPTSRKSHTLDCHLLLITHREDHTMQIAISPKSLTVIASKHTVSDYAPL